MLQQWLEFLEDSFSKQSKPIFESPSLKRFDLLFSFEAEFLSRFKSMKCTSLRTKKIDTKDNFLAARKGKLLSNVDFYFEEPQLDSNQIGNTKSIKIFDIIWIESVSIQTRFWKDVNAGLRHDSGFVRLSYFEFVQCWVVDGLLDQSHGLGFVSRSQVGVMVTFWVDSDLN